MDRFYIQGNGDSQFVGQLTINSTSAANTPVAIKGNTSQTANLLEMQDNTSTVVSNFDSNGAWQPPSLADSSANNNSIYFSTTQSRLVYKDSGGTVNNLY